MFWSLRACALIALFVIAGANASDRPSAESLGLRPWNDATPAALSAAEVSAALRSSAPPPSIAASGPSTSVSCQASPFGRHVTMGMKADPVYFLGTSSTNDFEVVLPNLVPDSGSFGQKMQLAELDYLFSSQAAMTAMAENYVGLPLD